jgi:hypothetical protein
VDLFSLSDIIRVIISRMMRWAQHVASMEERGGTFKVMVWKTAGNRQLGRARRRWEDNIKWIFKKYGGG